MPKTKAARAKAEKARLLAGRALLLAAPIPKRNARAQIARPGQGTRERDTTATVKAARLRHGIDVKDLDKALAGYPVGIAVLSKRISQDDHDLCHAFALQDEAARRADGRPPINPPAIVLGATRGRARHTEPTAADLVALRLYRSTRDRLVAVLGSAGFIQFENIVLSDCPLVSPMDLYVLQLGCNTLRRSMLCAAA